MKKTFLFAIAITIFIACSSEQDSIQPTNSNAVSLHNLNVTSKLSQEELGTLYKSMIESSDYIALNHASQEFLAKMNFDGSPDILEKESLMLSWISSNISKTSFTNYNAAVSEWGQLKNLNSTIETNNHGFYSAAIDADPSEFADVISPIGSPVYTTDGCGCSSAYTACNKGSYKLYNEKLKTISDSFLDSTSQAVANLGAYMRLKMDLKSCSNALTLCNAGCE